MKEIRGGDKTIRMGMLPGQTNPCQRRRIRRGPRAEGETGSRRFQRLRALRCWDEVQEQLLAGYPVPEVARFIQEEEGEYRDVKRGSLVDMLRQYISEELSLADLIAPRLPNLIVKANKEFGERLEDLRRMERVYEAMLYRLDLAHGRERRTGEISPDVDRQAKVVIDLIRQMHEIKMDLGLTGSRDLGTLTVSEERLAEIREKYGEGAAQAFADPVQRAQVLGLLKRVMRLSGRSDIIDVPAEGEGEAVEQALVPVRRSPTAGDE
jgi:hypothetical protein